MNIQSHELAPQFDTAKQQQSAATLGMWAFIATEVLFFGALFLIYTVYRAAYPLDFATAAKELNIFIGTLNTAILLSSSFFMALAVYFIEENKTKEAIVSLITTWLLGALFLILKAYEYYDDIQKHIVPTHNVVTLDASSQILRLFYLIYYTLTGVHALHVTIGLAVILVIIKTYQKKFSKTYNTPLELAGLYWHFVDIIWIFLYPFLYLVGRE